MIEFLFFFFGGGGGMPIKALGSLRKIRVGRESGNTHFFWPKHNDRAADLSLFRIYAKKQLFS